MNDVILFTAHVNKNEIPKLSAELKKALFYRFKKKFNIRVFVLNNLANFKHILKNNENVSVKKKN